MPKILISQAPIDPEEKKAWASQMARTQYAMWVDDGAKCAECGEPYKSVDDFLERNPRAGEGMKEPQNFDEFFVDEACFQAYAAKHGIEIGPE